jgi:hypothetical protein
MNYYKKFEQTDSLNKYITQISFFVMKNVISDRNFKFFKILSDYFNQELKKLHYQLIPLYISKGLFWDNLVFAKTTKYHS